VSVLSAVDAVLGQIDERLIKSEISLKITYFEILRLLSRSQKRWSEINHTLNVPQATLIRRLKELAELGIITRSVIPSFPPKVIYALKQVRPTTKEALDRWTVFLQGSLIRGKAK